MKKKTKICKPCYLVRDWRRAWRWLSVQIMVLIAAAQGLLEFLPTIKEFISPSVWHWSMFGLAMLAIIGRLINQTNQPSK